MVMYYLKSRDLRKIEGREFTLRIQKNSQDSVRLTDETQVPMRFRSVEARIDGQLWEMIVASLPCELERLLVASIRPVEEYKVGRGGILGIRIGKQSSAGEKRLQREGSYQCFSILPSREYLTMLSLSAASATLANS